MTTDRYDQWCRDNGLHVHDDEGVVVEVAPKWTRATLTPTCPACGGYMLPCTTPSGIHPNALAQ